MERVHCTLMGKAHAMRSYAKVPVNRWDELVITACYLTNCMPVKSQQGRTPYERWYGHFPDLSHLREIRSCAFVLVQGQHNLKVLDWSVECVLIGYSPDSKVYRCYHRASGKVFTSFHVSFIKSHQSPSAVSPPPSIPPILPPDTCTTLSSMMSSSTDPPAASSPPPLCHSSHVSCPTEKHAAAIGEPHIPAFQCTLLAAMAAAEAQPPNFPSADPPPPLLPNDEDDDGDWFTSSATSTHPTDPATYQKAMASPNTAEWTCALQEEFTSLKELRDYCLVPRPSIPPGCRIMRGHPIFKLKHDEHGNPSHFKARYVCHGYSAVYGQDYTKTTSSTSCMESFHILAHIGAALDWEIEQLDIKTAFLNGILELEEICYMEQPEGFIKLGYEDHVWELQHGLYGMKQGGHVWNKTLHNQLMAWSFTCLDCEYCVYYHHDTTGIVVLAIHIDDFFMLGDSKSTLSQFKTQLQTHWQISDGGPAHFHIGIVIERDRAARTIALSQMALIDRIVSQFSLADAHPIATPLEPKCYLSKATSPSSNNDRAVMSKTLYCELVGSLMYVPHHWYPS